MMMATIDADADGTEKNDFAFWGTTTIRDDDRWWWPLLTTFGAFIAAHR